MIIACTIALIIGFIALSAPPAFAWGPITHIALGAQVLASVSTLEQPLQAILLSMPDAFLYGSLAPDIVQGRRFRAAQCRARQRGAGLRAWLPGSSRRRRGGAQLLPADALGQPFQLRD